MNVFLFGCVTVWLNIRVSREACRTEHCHKYFQIYKKKSYGYVYTIWLYTYELKEPISIIIVVIIIIVIIMLLSSFS